CLANQPPSSQEGSGEVFFYSVLHFVCRPIRYSEMKRKASFPFAFLSFIRNFGFTEVTVIRK
ncbi:MAG: hypothetical protein IJK08_03550, partial [Prevotella sp.]|nr:hypothetical protein [Prevotella sp.]